ncbi:ExbD/TolR family protein [Inhella crocodyli]|uniref:Biopolymer transporter ExbD n=1 Tax=Inhella crocodyli TaxID=2499851 RepID=A0A437LTZ7_9BURK|nr:biopolymer transporter ExbD [Inhella crocodyli]RVT88858.1 biopolymer transporter ExbD [Inhella crocodyli]
MSFGRLARRDAAPPMSDINMTPLIDVMLVLLVIFLVAAPLMGAALRLDLPTSTQAEPAPAEGTQRLAIDAEGRLFWNDQALAPAALTAQLKALGRAQPQAEVQLSADRAVPYGTVATWIDALQGAGLSRVAFVTAPQGASSP